MRHNQRFHNYEGLWDPRKPSINFTEGFFDSLAIDRAFFPGLTKGTYPGTLNLEIIDLKDSQNLWQLKSTLGVEIIPEDPSFCSAQCYPVLINGRIKGAIVFPRVKDYPQNKIELIASQNVKEFLSVKGGDILEVEIL